MRVHARWLVFILVSMVDVAAATDPNEASYPRRIIAIAPNSAEIICAVGACDRIVGVSKFCVYPPELRERPRVGGFSDPDIERITALRPDLLVLRGRNPTLQKLCDDLKVRTYYDDTDTIAGIELCCRDLGRLLGLEKNAERVVGDLQARLEAVRTRVAGKSRPRVFVTVARDPERLANLLTTGKDTFLDQMIDIAGGVNVFGQLDMAYPQVSPEGILVQRPEVILELLPESAPSPAFEERLRGQWRQLGDFPAVQSDRIHILTDDNLLIPSLRFAEVIEKVSRLLHPEKDE